MTIGIQGIKGAFHEEAALHYYGQNIEINPYISFTDLVESVQQEESEKGVIAVENTISGTIHSNLNLIRKSGLHITGEIYLRIQQNLVAVSGAHIEGLRQVYSHYMAIDQCRNFFRQYPQIKLIESDDTALSMKEVTDKNDLTIGAIGSKTGAIQYKLDILAANIETNKKNYTRFLVIEKQENKNNPNFNKVSLNITLPNNKGSLSKILSIINSYDIDLCKIESVPIIGEPWHYMFYMDLLLENRNNYLSMLKAIEPLSHQIYIMGEYQSGDKSLLKIHNQK